MQIFNIIFLLHPVFSDDEKAEGWELEGGGEGDGEGWEVDDLGEDLEEEDGEEGSVEVAKYKVAARRATNNMNRMSEELKTISENLSQASTQVTSLIY